MPGALGEPVGRTMTLDRLTGSLNLVAVLGRTEGVVVSDIVFDDREVRPGALFCCLPGEHHDGHEFAGRAYGRGAVAFCCEHSLRGVGAAAQLVVAPGTARAAMAQLATAFYESPASQLRTVGVTGTNGKTTTTFLLGSIFESNGWRAGVLGTLDGPRTTAESPHLQRALRGLVDAGAAAVALEVTSHALVQHRVDGIVFDVAVFTNLSQDHLDYHDTMEEYFQAKASLFTPERARIGVVNADDPYGRRLLVRGAIPTVGYTLEDARDVEVGLGGCSFRLGGLRVHIHLGGEFNLRNALAAAAAARALGVGAPEIVSGLEEAPAVPGRYEAVGEAAGVTALVDFAHTPGGLEEVLRAARAAVRHRVGPVAGGATNQRAPARDGRVLVVFGCGGDRDRAKRPAMGSVAGELADVVVLTTDNPRSEDPGTIIEEIRAGITCAVDCHLEPDRRAAIALALSLAAPGDVVIVAGKGHETTQEFAGRTVGFDDREVVRQELERLAADAGEEDSR